MAAQEGSEVAKKNQECDSYRCSSLAVKVTQIPQVALLLTMSFSEKVNNFGEVPNETKSGLFSLYMVDNIPGKLSDD